MQRKACLVLLATICFCQAQDTKNGTKEALLKKFLQSYVEKSEAAFEREKGKTRYYAAFVDLNDDGKKEAIVYIVGGAWCGTGGCPMLILRTEGHSYHVITETGITQLPIRMLKTKSNGWHDLSVVVAGGGIQPGYEAKLSFDGESYPTNPSVSPAEKIEGKIPGTTLVPDTMKFWPLYP